jgi:tRNA pseudouridine55 synthase
MPIEAAAAASFAVWPVDAEEAVAVGHGAQLTWPEFLPADEPAAIFGPDGTFLALAQRREGRAKLLAVFV